MSCIEKESSRYRMWVSVNLCRSDGAPEGAKVYGLRVSDGRTVWEYPDISTTEADVQIFVDRISRFQPAPEHLPDIVEDYVALL